MKLWILRPTNESTQWEPWYDKAFGFVVRAETEEEARKLANTEAGDENRGDGLKKTVNVWLLPEHTTCTELTANGPAEIVMRDFAAA